MMIFRMFDILALRDSYSSSGIDRMDIIYEFDEVNHPSPSSVRVVWVYLLNFGAIVKLDLIDNLHKLVTHEFLSLLALILFELLVDLVILLDEIHDRLLLVLVKYLAHSLISEIA